MVEIQVTNATAVEVTDDRLSVELDDGRRRVRHRSRSGLSLEKSKPNVRSAPPERINPNST
jgi:hypothetical protein